MDPAYGETGGKSLSSKMKPKASHSRVKDKVISLKNRLPGMKKHNGEEDAHEDSSEYDETSPRAPSPETGHNVANSTPFTPGKAMTDSSSPRFSPREVHHSDYDSRPVQSGISGYDSRPVQTGISGYDSRPVQSGISGYDSRPVQTGYDSKPVQTGYESHNTNYVASPPARPAPTVNDSPRSHLAPALEEKFQHLGVGGNPTSPHFDAAPAPTDHGFQPEQQFSSPSAAESVQKGYSDVPQSSFRSSTTPATAASNKGMLDKVKASVVGATAVLGDKMGYYNDHSPADPNAPSMLTKAKSTLGMDKPRDPNAPPLTERAKGYMNVATLKTREYSATAADHAAWTKDRVAAHSTPTHHDKALSEQVTQSLDSLTGVVKEKMFGPASASSRAPNSPGIVDRVSGVVSSLFTAPPKDAGAHMQHTFPAHSDYHAPADRGSVPERMAATSAPDYSTVNN